MRLLGEATSRIGDVVDLIKPSPRRPTCSRLLTPTIEAAGAGEAGKGFRSSPPSQTLASQTARRPRRFSSQINAVQSASGDVVTAIDGISRDHLYEDQRDLHGGRRHGGAAARATSEIAPASVSQGPPESRPVSRRTSARSRGAAAPASAPASCARHRTIYSAQAQTLRREMPPFLKQLRAA